MLRDSRLALAQRQALAVQLSRSYGNHRLARALAASQPLLPVSRVGPVVQRSPVSDELAETWDSEGKAAFFDELRQLTGPDEDLLAWIDATLTGDDPLACAEPLLLRAGIGLADPSAR